MKHMLRSWIGLTAALAVVVIAGGASVAGQKQEEFRFRSGVDLVNVTATVVDRNGRFVPGLRQEDFIVYEENELQEVTHFSNERVPVSLGHRARHERQHGRREADERADGGRSLSDEAARRRRTRSSSTSSATFPSWCRTGRPIASG